MEKVSKFQQFQNVMISGNYTGLGDMQCVIYEVDYNELDDSFYYLVSCISGGRFYCHEKFLSI